DITGPTTSTTTFTTSGQLAPDLQLSGALHASLRAGMAPIQRCDSCGRDCMVIGERPALFADVVMPTVSGGFDAYGYQALLTFNDDSRPVFDGPGEGRLIEIHRIT